MTLVVVTGPTTEPLTVAEVVQHCRIDASNQELAPGAVTAALAATPIAGNVDNGAHRYLATFVTADGETEAGVVSSAVTVADKTVNGKVELTAIPLGGSLVTSRKIYRTAAAGSTYLLLTTIADNTTTTYTDNTADSSLGAGAPSTNTTADPQITQWIKSARRQAELYTHRYLITQTIDAYFDRFDGDYLTLPPLQSVTSITYTDADGASTVWASDQYRVDSARKPARISPAYGVSWPSTRDQTGAVVVRFVAGYGAASAVPEDIKTWMLMRIKHRYDHRAPAVPGGASAEFPHDLVDGLLDGERVLARA